MRRKLVMWAVLALALGAGCDDAPTVGACAESYTPVEGALYGGGCCTGVDLLVVVDTSSTMAEEQGLLADALYALVGALTGYGPEAPYHAVDNLRVAVVTSDLGVAYGEDLEVSDAVSIPSCEDRGDEGVFQRVGFGSQTIAGETVSCPFVEDAWAGISEWDDDADEDVALEAACLARQGTEGCGIEQPLASAVAALNRNDQTSFVGCGCDLLAVLLVTDEDDCSMEDAPGLFGTAEFESSATVNIACHADQDNEGYLFDVETLFEMITWADAAPGRVLFAAIAGVPNEGEAGAACEGWGDEIGACLDQDAMQRVPEQPGLPGDGAWAFRPACTRTEGAATVTDAKPARRIVELAADYFGTNAYVSSICDADWGPAIDDVATLIKSQALPVACLRSPLAWDAVEKVPSDCEIVVAFTNPDGNACPWPLDEGADAMIEAITGSDGNAITTVYCPLPKLPLELDCDDNAAYPNDAFGWYYCENRGHEDNERACDDGSDNDGDGRTDCADTGEGASPGCDTCFACGGNGSECRPICPYDLEITRAAQSVLLGVPLKLRCVHHDDCGDDGVVEI